MSKDLSISVLMDFYGELLTDKQRDTLDLYYNRDYSLAEIAQDLDISRQGVRDFIKRGEKQLAEFEAKLGMVKKYEKISAEIAALESLFDSNRTVIAQAVIGEAEKILGSIKEEL